jgi:proteasome lid subunit RPN8/RPN11
MLAVALTFECFSLANISANTWIYYYRPEMVVGWYHSHPGFGCWLSGVDINTQQVHAYPTNLL